jgi:hypothetical protein
LLGGRIYYYPHFTKVRSGADTVEKDENESTNVDPQAVESIASGEEQWEGRVQI